MWHVAGLEIVPRNHALIINTFLWTMLALITTFLRLYTRAIVVKRLGWDDGLMAAAMVK